MIYELEYIDCSGNYKLLKEQSVFFSAPDD